MQKDFIVPSGENACRISIHAVPRASKTEVCGMQGNALKLRLQAPPVDGKANKALVEYLSKLFKVPKTSIEILRGETGKDKTLLFKTTDVKKLELIKGILAK